jgi:hypothetical protein
MSNRPDWTGSLLYTPAQVKEMGATHWTIQNAGTVAKPDCPLAILLRRSEVDPTEEAPTCEECGKKDDLWDTIGQEGGGPGPECTDCLVAAGCSVPTPLRPAFEAYCPWPTHQSAI